VLWRTRHEAITGAAASSLDCVTMGFCALMVTDWPDGGRDVCQPSGSEAGGCCDRRQSVQSSQVKEALAEVGAHICVFVA